MSNPIISVIVNSYNGADHLKETVDAILGQSYCDIELILVDDGSSDNTYQMMQQYAKNDQRVRCVSQENSGPSVARDTGYKLSSGKFVIFSDDDDIMHQKLLERLHEALEKNETASATCTFSKNVPSDDISGFDWETLPSIKEIYPNVDQTIDGLDALSLRRNSVENTYICCSWGVLYRRDFIDSLVKEYYNYKASMPEYYFDDTMTAFITMSKGTTFAVTDRPYILYRVADDSISHKLSLSKHCKNMIYPMQAHVDYYKNLELKAEYAQELLGLFMILIRTYIIEYYYVEDEAEKNHYFSEIRRIYNEYINELKKQHYSGMDAIMQKAAIRFEKHPVSVAGLIKKVKKW